MQDKILIIDDEPLILSTIEKALRKIGYDVTTVKDIKSFRDALETQRFSLLIMDLHMDGINANDLIKEAQGNIPAIKFLTISGSTSVKNSKHFLSKPFRIDALRERVREILDEPS
jgi:DNA-binding response OmpR family regulator